MKVYIKSSSRYVLHDGKQLKLNEGETKAEAVARYKDEIAKEEAAALEAKRLAKEEEEARRAERRRTPRYKNGTIVITKDGEYYKVYDGYFYNHYNPDYPNEMGSIYYDAEPCTPDGKLDMPDDLDDYRWSSFPYELDQRDIKRKIK